MKSVYMVTYRIGQFFSGLWQQIKSSLDAAGEAFYPVFGAIYEILFPVCTLLFNIAQALGLVGSSVPSSAFMTFGKVIGWLISSPLRMLAWTLKILWTPVSLLAKAISWILDLIAAIPKVLLPKNLANLLSGFGPRSSGLGLTAVNLKPNAWSLKPAVAAGSLALTMAATPVVAGEKPDNLRQAQLLAEKNTYYYQTVNNQRTENTSVATPVAPPDQRPLEVKLHLDGREIYRAVVNRERENGVRSNG